MIWWWEVSSARDLGCQKPVVGGEGGLMLTGHWDCTQTWAIAEGESVVAPGGMEPSPLRWGTGGVGTSSDGSCCQIIWESGRLRALGDGSELLGQAMASLLGSLRHE